MNTENITQIKDEIGEIESRLRNFPREVSLYRPKLAVLQKKYIEALEGELLIKSRGFFTLKEARERADQVNEISRGVYEYTYKNQRFKIDNGVVVKVDW